MRRLSRWYRRRSSRQPSAPVEGGGEAPSPAEPTGAGLAFTPLRITPTYNASKAAIHMLSESVRLQLSGTSVSVVELVPPAVRTELMPGHEENEHAMPLDEFIAEVMGLIESQPDAKEIQVERVKFLRYGEARGDYDQVVETLNAPQPVHP